MQSIVHTVVVFPSHHPAVRHQGATSLGVRTKTRKHQQRTTNGLLVQRRCCMLTPLRVTSTRVLMYQDLSGVLVLGYTPVG